MEKTVLFGNLMDHCHLKNAELAKHLQRFKERVVLQGNNVKDEKRYPAVLTKQSASVLQMAGATFLDTISKLPGMSGETIDAVSAHTQVEMTQAPGLLRLSKEACPQIRSRILPRQRPNSWNNIEDTVVPFEWNVYGHISRPLGQKI